MRDKNDSYMSEDPWKEGREWHVEFPYMPEFPYPFPIVLAGTRPSTMLLGIFLLMAGFTSSTLKSLSRWCVLVCELVCKGMEPSQEAPGGNLFGLGRELGDRSIRFDNR